MHLETEDREAVCRIFSLSRRGQIESAERSGDGPQLRTRCSKSTHHTKSSGKCTSQTKKLAWRRGKNLFEGFCIAFKIMKNIQTISLLVIAALLTGCTTWGYKMPMGRTFPKTDYRMVKVLFNPPTDKYEEVGLCSVLGGAAFITSDVDMFQKLRKSAADMGADAVIVIREQSTRMSSIGGSGSAGAAWNQYGGSYGSSWGMGGSSIEYPRNTGMAIKYSDPAKQLAPK